jgi:hypothetical protein
VPTHDETGVAAATSFRQALSASTVVRQSDAGNGQNQLGELVRLALQSS